jgi:hypothetical protein
VNFIGHAAVALWTSQHPSFVLGAMLPDFAGMARLRLATAPADPELARGIALHHRTDQVFHEARAFQELSQAVVLDLTRQGVARGPARAVGHVGVEMFIDGELVGDGEVATAYLDALCHVDAIEPLLPDPGARERWWRLAQRLTRHGVPYDYKNPAAVATRLGSILASRPRLALDPGSERIVRSVLPDLQHRVAARLPELLDSVRENL